MTVIDIIGTGLTAGDLTFVAAEKLKSGAHIILHTERIGAAEWMNENGITFESLDHLYEQCEDFDEHAYLAAEYVLEAAKRYPHVVYGVYDVRDRSVLKITQSGAKVSILAGPPVEGALYAYPDGAVQLLEASDWENFHLSPEQNVLVREINSRALASEVKLKLMECYPDESVVRLLNGDGSINMFPLYDLDRMKRYDHRSCALVYAEHDLMNLQRYSFDELLRVMRILQSPGGCPWDREQTHESLRTFMLEETCEAIDAINQGDTDHLYDELGDILMLVVMQAGIGQRCGEFDITDATTAICEKMIQRHTHIFGADRADDAGQVLDLWSRNKMKERGQTTHTEVLRGVSRSLPGLMYASKLMDKAAHAGVEQKDIAALCEEASLKIAALADDPSEQNGGDALFALCALIRAMHMDSEVALRASCERFIQRFSAMEEALAAQGIALPNNDDENSKKYWNRVKL